MDYKEQCQTMENRLLEVNQLANQSQLQLNDTTDVIKSLEERLKSTEVRTCIHIFYVNSCGFYSFFFRYCDLFFWCIQSRACEYRYIRPIIEYVLT